MCAALCETTEWVVHKFGGTSVANAECLRNVVKILLGSSSRDNRLAIVVSAMGGKPKVTDMLLDCVAATARNDKKAADDLLNGVREKHVTALHELVEIDEADRRAVLARLEKDLEDVKNLLRAVAVMRVGSPQISELVSGYGETWSAQILTALLRASGANFVYVDARDVLLVAPTDLPSECGAIAWKRSGDNVQQLLKKHENADDDDEEAVQLVITGYIASTLDGAPTTLKRDGSDYSASIFGKLLSASAVHIWTDVDGVLSADPRRVPEAFSLEEVTYEEAMELAYFGAKVLHPKTMTPAVEASIPLFIRNTFNPSGPGTRISLSCNRESMMAGFTTVDRVAVLNICGRGMLGVPGVISKAAQALQKHGISVRLIAQASSEQSIALAIDDDECPVAIKALSEAFAHELREGSIAKVDAVTPCSIIAAVSRHLDAQAPGRFYDALGRASIKLVASAQGCDERNISAVVHERDSRRALRCVHSAFLSHQTVAVALVGAGFVGSALLEAIRDAADQLLIRFNVKLRVCAIMHGDDMVLADAEKMDDDLNIDLDHWREKLRSNPQRADFGEFVRHLEEYRAWVPNLVVVDTSYSVRTAKEHVTWLEHRFHVVNANQRAVAGPLELFEDILRARDAAGRCLYCSEACVGGGVPIIDTLRNLVHGGDTVQFVECVMSASMSFIFSRVSPAEAARSKGANEKETKPPSFAEVMREAWVSGLLENDPLLDISGQDSATKLLALGRELGLALEPRHVESDSLPGLDEILKREEEDPPTPNSNIDDSLAAFKSLYANWRSGNDHEMMVIRSPSSSSSSITTRTSATPTVPLNIDTDSISITPPESPSPSEMLLSPPRSPRSGVLRAHNRPNLGDEMTVRVERATPGDDGVAIPIEEEVLEMLSDALELRLAEAHARGKVIRHVGRIDVKSGEVRLRLEEVDPTHAFAQLQGPELCVRFFTERYAATPLTVQGPLFAAGTASGCFAELLRVVRHCSGHDRPTYSYLRRTPSMATFS